MSDEDKVIELKRKQREIVFELVPWGKMRFNPDEVTYLVKGLLPLTGLAVIWGPPKTYKSFWTLDVGFHVAEGKDYRGRRVQQRPVVYVALEGQEGMRKRVEAYCQRFDIDDSTFFNFILTSLNLRAQAGTLMEDLDRQLLTYPGMIIIDTFNRSLVGSESRDEDVAAYLAAAGKVQEHFGCLVVLVHHCGWDDSRMRGHSSLAAAVDVELSAKSPAPYRIVVCVERAKDAVSGVQIFSKLDRVELGRDCDGDMADTLIVLPVDEAEEAAMRQQVEPLTADQQAMLFVLENAGAGGLTTKSWYGRAKEQTGIKNSQRLFAVREQLKRKERVIQDRDDVWVAASCVRKDMSDA
jgi:hypothetical protein